MVTANRVPRGKEFARVGTHNLIPKGSLKGAKISEQQGGREREIAGIPLEGDGRLSISLKRRSREGCTTNRLEVPGATIGSFQPGGSEAENTGCR